VTVNDVVDASVGRIAAATLLPAAELAADWKRWAVRHARVPPVAGAAARVAPPAEDGAPPGGGAGSAR